MDSAAAESVLGAIYDDTVFYNDSGDDVEMIDAAPPASPQAAPAAAPARSQRLKARRKRNKKKRTGGAAPKITDINWFVVDACRRLKERKSYLMWNAVGCLGVSAVKDLLLEVEAIMKCGGQKTADGNRMRNGGGILWNILKTREPKAYKEIMAKGREFEKQFRQPKAGVVLSQKNEDNVQDTNPSGGDNVQDTNPSGGDNVQDTNPSGGGEEVMQSADQIAQSDSSPKHRSVLNRIRVPVSYGDLFEEGEIKESV